MPLPWRMEPFRLIISDNLQMFVNFFEEEEKEAQLCLPPTQERRLSVCLAAISPRRILKP